MYLVQILSPEIDMISEMRNCFLFGRTEAAAAKAVGNQMQDKFV
jgi:hypothetical protein